MRNITLRGRGLSKLLLIGALGLVCLIGFQAAAAAQQGSEIEDILYEKGSITKEEWLKIKASKEKAQATQEKGMSYGTESKDKSSSIMKGVDIGVTFYLNATYATGTSFTGSAQNGVANSTANENKGLASGFHFTRTYLNVRKYFEEGHEFRLTLDQMVNHVGGGDCTGNTNAAGGKCTEAAPFGLSGFGGTGRNSTFVKYAYYDHNFSPALHLRVGMHQTPWIEYEEHRWTYRYLFPTMVDQQGFQTSSDLGVSLLGKALNNMVDYHISFQEGEGYQNTADGRGYAGLGRISVEPIKGAIISAFYHNERERNGTEGFNPQRLLGNVEVYDPSKDTFKINAQMVWGDDGADVGRKGFPTAINVPGTYNTNATVASDTAATLGSTAGPLTSIPRFHQARGYELWAWYRIPNFEKVRLHGRYYFMKPNKDTPAGDIQSYYFGVSYDYSKFLAFSVDYTVLQETVLGSIGLPGQNISTNGACGACGQYVNYNNQIIGLRALITF